MMVLGQRVAAALLALALVSCTASQPTWRMVLPSFPVFECPDISGTTLLAFGSPAPDRAAIQDFLGALPGAFEVDQSFGDIVFTVHQDRWASVSFRTGGANWYFAGSLSGPDLLRRDAGLSFRPRVAATDALPPDTVLDLAFAKSVWVSFTPRVTQAARKAAAQSDLVANVP